MKKLSMLLVAVLTMAMILGFAGCKQESDTPPGKKIEAIVTMGSWIGSASEIQFELYVAEGSDGSSWELRKSSQDYAKGTYTGGGIWSNGTKDCKMTHFGSAWTETSKNFQITVSKSGDDVTIPSSLFEGVEKDVTLTRR